MTTRIQRSISGTQNGSARTLAAAGSASRRGDLRFDVEDEIAEGDKVLQLVTMSGTHNGPLLGHQPSGRAVAVGHIYIWRIADGKIVETGEVATSWGSFSRSGCLRPPRERGSLDQPPLLTAAPTSTSTGMRALLDDTTGPAWAVVATPTPLRTAHR